MKRYVIYTVLTGGYDNLIQLTCVSQDFDYICFTDTISENSYNGIWNLRKIPSITDDKQRLSRFPKMHPHVLLSQYEYSVYIDASVDIINDELYNIFKEKINRGILLSGVKHPYRDCVYDEYFAVYRTKAETNLSLLKKEYKYLKYCNMPKHIGLFEAGMILRNHHDERIISQNEMWWLMVNKYSKRDQLSYTLSLWKNNIPFDYLENVGLNKPNRYCKLINHVDNTKKLPLWKKIERYVYFRFLYNYTPMLKSVFYFYMNH